MRKLTIFTAFYLVGVLQANPASKADSGAIIPSEVYVEDFVKYRAKHDIVDIIVPLNAINFGDDDSDSKSEENENTGLTVFFVEADVQDGKRVDQGLYKYKKDETKMILAKGRTAAASTNNNKLVFFGASDGLYVYNVDTDSADKYGPITDGIISMATDENGKIIYILTDDHELYKVTNNGETKEIIDDVKDAQEIVIDDGGLVYYRDSKNEVFIKKADGIVKVRLPGKPESIRLVRPPFILSDCIVVVHDYHCYVVNNTAAVADFDIGFTPETRPTAYGPESIFMQYYGHNKKLYEFDVNKILENGIFENIKDKTERIRDKAKEKKHTLGAKKA